MNPPIVQIAIYLPAGTLVLKPLFVLFCAENDPLKLYLVPILLILVVFVVKSLLSFIYLYNDLYDSWLYMPRFYKLVTSSTMSATDYAQDVYLAIPCQPYFGNLALALFSVVGADNNRKISNLQNLGYSGVFTKSSDNTKITISSSGYNYRVKVFRIRYDQ